MAFEKCIDIIKSAQKSNTSVFSVNCIDYNTIKGVIMAAEAVSTPVLVQLFPGHASEDAGSDLDLYTKPEAAKQFYEESGVDLLAIAIGNAHGFYKGIPHLDIDRLDAIHAATPGLALVLHGGSGIPDDQLEVAFSRGINKFNYGTNYLWTYYKALAAFVKEHEKEDYADVLDMSIPAQAALTEHMKERFHLCHFA